MRARFEIVWVFAGTREEAMRRCIRDGIFKRILFWRSFAVVDCIIAVIAARRIAEYLPYTLRLIQIRPRQGKKDVGSFELEFFAQPALSLPHTAHSQCKVVGCTNLKWGMWRWQGRRFRWSSFRCAPLRAMCRALKRKVLLGGGRLKEPVLLHELVEEEPVLLHELVEGWSRQSTKWIYSEPENRNLGGV